MKKIYRRMRGYRLSGFPVQRNQDWCSGLIAVCQSVLGECLTALGMFEEAEDLRLRSHDLLLSSKRKNDLQTTAARKRIISLDGKWNRPKKTDAWRGASQAP